MKKALIFLKKFWPETIFFTAVFIFSLWLMWHTFAYHQGTIYIAAKAWSDFAAHLPLIRSFSWGQNWPPQYPLFPGPFIHYHFLFYALVSLLGKSGLVISWALNLPSALVFWGLNIYTNQRHLALAFGLILLILILIIDKKFNLRRAILLGLLLGLMPFLHSAIFVMGIMVFGSLLILFKNSSSELINFIGHSYHFGNTTNFTDANRWWYC